MVAISFTTPDLDPNDTCLAIPPPESTRDHLRLMEAIDRSNHPDMSYCVTDILATFRSASIYDVVQREDQQKFDANLGERLKEEKKELTHERDQIQRKYPRDNRLINMNRRLKEIDRQLVGMR